MKQYFYISPLILFPFLTYCEQIMNESQNTCLQWLTFIHQTMPTNAGTFSAQDAKNASILVEWEKIEGKSPRLSEKVKEVSDILAQAYTKQELDFARKNPDAVPNEYFLKVLAPLFAEGIEKVDWQNAEVQLSHMFKQLFTTTDFAQYAGEHDISIFVVAKDQGSNAIMGVNQILITPEFPYGTVKSAYFGVAQAAYGRGLEKLLMGSIFKLIPTASRIFMHTRTTNEALISLYQSWGFTQFPGPMPHWIDLEYLAEKSDFLQNTTAFF
jgi:ribosomal protein S18 acetylase RimI-like enzyme